MHCISHTVYFGNIALYHYMHRCGSFILEAHENYQKKSNRNRSLVASPQKTSLLSVPLTKGKNNATPITAVEISYEDPWYDQHLRTLQMGYSNTPFYEYYIDDIIDLISSRHTYLWQLNTSILNYMIEILHVEADLSSTTSFTKDYSAEYLDLRGYQKEQTPSRDCIFDVYRQPFDDKYDFIPNLSILDLLFCKGPESILYLEKNIVCKALQTNK